MAIKGQTSELLRWMILSSFFLRQEAPDQFYVAVTTSPALAGISGESITEPSDVNYARVPYLVTPDYWVMTDLTTANNSQQIVFTAPGEDWGQLAGWAFLNAPVGGIVLAAGQLVEPVSVLAGQPPVSIDPLGIGVQLI